MKVPFLLSAALLMSALSQGQSNKAFAITGQGRQNFNWSNIREIDLATGQATRTIYEIGKTAFTKKDH